MARIRMAARVAVGLGGALAFVAAPAFAQEQPGIPQNQPSPERLSESDAPLQFFQQPPPQRQRQAQPQTQPPGQPPTQQLTQQPMKQAAPGGQTQAGQPAPQAPQAAQGLPLDRAPRMSLEPVSPQERTALDEAVRERLRIQFPALHAQVRVNVSEVGVVRLTGTVSNLAAKLAVGNVASEVPDHDYVVLNDVQVRPAKRDDRIIASDIRQAFARDPFLRGANVTVEVRDQTVYLAGGTAPGTGPIDELVIVDRAEQTAARVAGVREVINNGIL